MIDRCTDTELRLVCGLPAVDPFVQLRSSPMARINVHYYLNTCELLRTTSHDGRISTDVPLASAQGVLPLSMNSEKWFVGFYTNGIECCYGTVMAMNRTVNAPSYRSRG